MGEEAARKLNGQLARALTELRAEEFYPGCRVVHAITLLIGDELASQFAKTRDHLCPAAPLKINELRHLIPNRFYLGNEVQNVIIWIGSQFIRDKNGAAEALETKLTELMRTLEAYQKKIFIVTPPLIENKEAELLLTKQAIGQICLDFGAIRIFPAFSKREGSSKFVDSHGNETSAGFDLLEEEFLLKGVQFGRILTNKERKEQKLAAGGGEGAGQPKNRLPVGERLKGLAKAGAVAFVGNLAGTSAKMPGMGQRAENNQI